MPDYFEFEVSHLHIKPRIWRRFLLPVTGSTFLDLHMAIQDAGPWRDYHLWRFEEHHRGGEILATTPGQGEPMFPDDEPIPDADDVPLKRYFTREGPTRCDYWYDFGDDWWARVELRKRQRLSEKFYRKLLAGRRAYPIEDSGGPYGYSVCVACLDPKIMQAPDLDPDDREYLTERREWVREIGWDPETFDLAVGQQYFDAVGAKGLRRPYHQLDPEAVLYRA